MRVGWDHTVDVTEWVMMVGISGGRISMCMRVSLVL